MVGTGTGGGSGSGSGGRGGGCGALESGTARSPRWSFFAAGGAAGGGDAVDGAAADGVEAGPGDDADAGVGAGGGACGARGIPPATRPFGGGMIGFGPRLGPTISSRTRVPGRSAP